MLVADCGQCRQSRPKARLAGNHLPTLISLAIWTVCLYRIWEERFWQIRLMVGYMIALQVTASPLPPPPFLPCPSPLPLLSFAAINIKKVLLLLTPISIVCRLAVGEPTPPPTRSNWVGCESDTQRNPAFIRPLQPQLVDISTTRKKNVQPTIRPADRPNWMGPVPL
jgi:hypothetical protein